MVKNTTPVKLPVFVVTFVVTDAFWRPGDALDISRWLAFLNMLAKAPFFVDGLVFLQALLTGSILNQYKQTNKHPFNGLFSRSTLACQQQKAKTILGFNKARDGDVAVASAEPYVNHFYLAPDV